MGDEPMELWMDGWMDGWTQMEHFFPTGHIPECNWLSTERQHQAVLVSTFRDKLYNAACCN